MIPTAFDEENNVLGAPPGMDRDCDALSVWQGQTQGGQPLVVSCWKVTAEELDEIKRTGRVWLMIWGNTMPPAAVIGMNPFAPVTG